MAKPLTYDEDVLYMPYFPNGIKYDTFYKKTVVNKKIEALPVDIIENPILELDYSNIAFKNIDMLGFEIEGAWNDKRDDLIDDASFHKEDFGLQYLSVGEFVSIPMATFGDFVRHLKYNWPDNYNSKCGLHVHFSLKSVALYNICMEKRFYKEFLIVMEKWGKDNGLHFSDLFWERLSGANKYCKKIFIPDEQAAFKDKGLNRLNRRTQLHYCFGQTKTIECRLFPMFKNVEIAISAIITLINFIENYTKDRRLDNYTSKCHIPIIESDNSIKKKNYKFNLFKINKNKKNSIIALKCV